MTLSAERFNMRQRAKDAARTQERILEERVAAQAACLAMARREQADVARRLSTCSACGQPQSAPSCDQQMQAHRHGGHNPALPCPCSVGVCSAFHAGVAWAREHPAAAETVG